ncbi:putative TM2 domain [Monocercomonoides exilis]|uniref:putative TM2 domain n=1 Tax=Monocercomonoides exilis TaxID=2049356 RepID=UPI00355A883C|nr:putative TM2 domain [Monocercomonoides exilis]|eukprot:MONOS_14244.1-p1 / transcript=MONOS_14244.1 / gene=MONOS_14244 / organism=Monocercomonoides_exilis_PA203 / gene_product=unspecified product / transcript_product=unspecified product / location=Mono_scaffold00962:1405-1941(+) / protein_length=178 / sequence_SO=supercontig / SO=protein_coding / is_pseudo=false
MNASQVRNSQPVRYPFQNAAPMQQVYVPGQPVMIRQTYAVPQYIVPPLFDPRTYANIQWSDSISNTVSGGIPAWGKGQFDSSFTLYAWFACLLGFSGMHRVYLGDFVMGAIYCLTTGLCGIGQLIDLCMLAQMVDDRNTEIMNAVRYKATAQANFMPQTYQRAGQPVIQNPVQYKNFA